LPIGKLRRNAYFVPLLSLKRNSSVYNYNIRNTLIRIEEMGVCYPKINEGIRESNAIPLNDVEKSHMKHPHCVKRCPIA
jgi:hypothetical protein